ncbi:hypothetical protein D3C75_906780 [compost metagenome]
MSLERRRHSNQESIRRLGYGGGSQVTFGYRCMNHHVQIRFYNMNFTLINRFNSFRVHIDTDHSLFPRSEYRCGRQPYVTEPDYRNSFECHVNPYKSDTFNSPQRRFDADTKRRYQLQLEQCFDYTLTGSAIPVRVMGVAHRLVSLLVIEQLAERTDNLFCLGTN